MRSKPYIVVLVVIAVITSAIIFMKDMTNGNNVGTEVVQAEKTIDQESTGKKPAPETTLSPQKESASVSSDPGTVPSSGTPGKQVEENHPKTGEPEGTKQETVVQQPKESPASSKAAIPDAVEQKASSITNKEVDSQDYFKAAGVILGKLSLGEIKFLYDTASDDFWVTTPVEDIEKVRKIIFSKLTAEDIATLRELGKKYGRSMTILDPNLDVAATKEKQIAAKKKSK